MQRAGDAAEAYVQARLESLGWQMIARNLHLGRLEIDILAIDPGPPPRLVVVEVRWRSRRDFGLPEETLDWRKIGRLRAAAGGLAAGGAVPGGHLLPRLPIAVDLVTVEPSDDPEGDPRIRHHRDVLMS
jgi:putative endonuclease